MSSNSREPNEAELDRARRFIERSRWIFAKTMPKWPHEYCLRENARAQGLGDEFTWFVETIYSAGYSRPWGKWIWPSLDVGPRYYWTHWGPTPGEPVSVEEAILINRAVRDQPTAEPTQLSMEVDR